MRAIDLHHQGVAKVICTWEHEGVLVDPGPQATEETLLAALGDLVPSAVLLTHIHFDHAGATGSLVRRWPDLPVYVHAVGARHLPDPERLVRSATRLYGEEGMQRLWGEVVPVPQENLHVLEGGETILGGEYRVAYTPGHASHHVSYLHEPTGRAFVGDVAGVRIPPCEYTVAPTPPPDLDVLAWEASLDRIAEWSPKALMLTHWGQVDAVEAQLAAVRERLHEEVVLADKHGAEAFAAGMLQRIDENVGDLTEAYHLAAPPDHLYLGLARWLKLSSQDGPDR